MYAYPIGFGLAVSLVNIRKIKVNKLLGILLCIGISALTFVFSVFLTYGLAYSLGGLTTFVSEEIATIIKYVGRSTIFISGGVAAIIMYWGYSYLFSGQNRNRGVFIVFVSTLLVPIVFFIWRMLNTNMFIKEPLMYSVSWLMLVSLAFGIAINQNEITFRAGQLRKFLLARE